MEYLPTLHITSKDYLHNLPCTSADDKAMHIIFYGRRDLQWAEIVPHKKKKSSGFFSSVILKILEIFFFAQNRIYIQIIKTF